MLHVTELNTEAIAYLGRECGAAAYSDQPFSLLPAMHVPQRL